MFDNRIVERRAYVREFLTHVPETVVGRLLLRRIGAPIVETDDVTDEERPGRYVEYGSSEELTVSLPVDGEAPKRIRTARGTYPIRQPFVRELRDATLVGPYPFTRTQRGEAVTTTVAGKRRYVHQALAYVLLELGWREAVDLLTTDPPQSIDVAFPLLHPIEAYSHWLLEYVPKLRALEVYEAETGTTPPVLVNPDTPQWMVDTIRTAGFEGDLVEFDATSVSVDRLVVRPHYPGLMTDYRPDPDRRWLRERLFDAVDLDVGDFPDRIYVSRADTDWRRVCNRDEVLDVLGEYGFESVRPAELDVADQVRLFANADVVVAPHGSALANLLFGRDLSVMVLYPPVFSAEFLCLCEYLGFDFEYHVGTGVGPRRGESVFDLTYLNQDFAVDPAVVRDTVERWI